MVSFASQQLGGWVGFVLWALLTVPLPFWLSRYGPLGRAFEALSIATLTLGPAFLVGRGVQRWLPDIAVSGRWLWLVPSSFVSASLFSSLVHSTLGRDLVDLFYPPPEGEAWWAVLFFTYPTLGFIGYAVGIAFETVRDPSSTPLNGRSSSR